MKERTLTKKLTTIFISIMLAAMGLVFLGGCAASPAQEIRDDINYQLGGLKNHDQAAINDLLSNIMSGQIDTLRDLSVNLDEYVDSYLDGFDYTIGDINVQGNQATVQLTIRYKDPAQVSEAIQKSVTNYLGDGSVFNLFGGNADETQAESSTLGNLVMEAVQSVQNTDVKNLTIQFENKDGRWVPTENLDALLNSVIFS